MKGLEISSNLTLPSEDFLEAAAAFIGKRGRGKSGLVKVLMEELVDKGLPFVAFDPVGVMWGINSSLDGSGPGLGVLVIGGPHGDLELVRNRGADVAKAVLQANVSVIVDFSEEPKAAYREFVRDFSHALFRFNETPRIVILEEAPELVPQRLRPDMTQVFEAVERLVSRGRNKGLGVVLVSQRAATINKDVLTQIDALFIFGLVSPQDRKALGDWVEVWDAEDKAGEFYKGLAHLHSQECWAWAPEAFGGLFKKIRVRDFRTYHPDKTHLRRMGLLKSKPVISDITGAGVVAKIAKQLGLKMRIAEAVATEQKEREAYETRIRELEHEAEKYHKLAGNLQDELARMKVAVKQAANVVRDLPAIRNPATRDVAISPTQSVPVQLGPIDIEAEEREVNIKHYDEVRDFATTNPQGRIMYVLIQDLGKASTITEITEALVERGWNYATGTLSAEVSKLVNNGDLVQQSRSEQRKAALYRVPGKLKVHVKE